MKKNKPKPPKPWQPDKESFDVALMRQHEYMKQFVAWPRPYVQTIGAKSSQSK